MDDPSLFSVIDLSPSITIGHDPCFSTSRLSILNPNAALFVDGTRFCVANFLISPSTLIETDYQIDFTTKVARSSNFLSILHDPLAYELPFHCGNLQSCLSFQSSKDQAFGIMTDSTGQVSVANLLYSTFDDSFSSDHINKKIKVDGNSSVSKIWTAQNFNLFANSKQISSNTGWVGLSIDSFTSSAISRLATVHFLRRTLNWFDFSSQSNLRSVPLLHTPTAICNNFQPQCCPTSSSSSTTSSSSPLTLVGEEAGSLSAWDCRQAESGGCVYREAISKAALYSITRTSEFEVLCGGGDRTLYLLDTRTWRSRLKWRSPCKYEVSKALPASSVSLPLRPNHFSLGSEEGFELSESVSKEAETESTETSTGMEAEKKTEEKSSVKTGTKTSRSSQRLDPSHCSIYLSGTDNELLYCDLLSPTASLPSEPTPEPSSTLPSSTPTNEANNTPLPFSSKLRLSHHRGVRSQSRWLGLDVVALPPPPSPSSIPSIPSSNLDGAISAESAGRLVDSGRDLLVGLCVSGKLYFVSGAERMRPAS